MVIASPFERPGNSRDETGTAMRNYTFSDIPVASIVFSVCDIGKSCDPGSAGL
jgi:hypothetical protein